MATYSPAVTDDAAFGVATDLVSPIGGLADEAAPDSVNEGDIGAVRMSLNRALHTKVRDDAGNERGLNIDASGSAQVVGSVAHDGVDANAPVKVGGQARQTNPTAVADADRVNATFDDLGRQVVVLNNVRDLVTQNTTTITSSTSETTILTAVASTFLDVTCLIFTNTSSTGTRVDIRDDTAGTVRLSVWVPANDIRGVVLQTPMPQTATNKNWTAQCGTSVSDLRVFIQAVKNV